MPDWARDEHRRSRYSHGRHLAVPDQRTRRERSAGSERRRPSLDRAYHSEKAVRRHDYHSDDDANPVRRRSARRRIPSPPRAIDTESLKVDADRERGPSALSTPISPPTLRLSEQDQITIGIRRQSTPNLAGLGLQLPDPDLTRRDSAPKLHESRSEGNLATRASHVSSTADPPALSSMSNNGHLYDVPPSHPATTPAFDPATTADPRPGNGHRLSLALISGPLGAESYQYNLLKPREFRLVKIFSASMSDIRCEIVTHSLDTPPLYTAISYAWGDPDDKAEITLEKDSDVEYPDAARQRVTKSVTASLHGALHALRHQDRDVFVWVDSLSIDQQNKDELSWQIPLMSEIYRKAAVVAIWLGPHYDDSEKALRLIQALSDSAESPKSICQIIYDEQRQADFVALVSLFEREYWTRLWVVQEVFVPDPLNITVYCGKKHLPWTVYKAASGALRRHKSDVEFCYSGTEDHSRGQRVSLLKYSFAQVLEYRGPASLSDGTLRDLGDQPLLDVMRACRNKLTAMPLDKVYGIRGLLSRKVQDNFLVNYKMSVKRLYIDVVDHILTTTQRVDVLRESIHFPLHVGNTALPSWCPDWSYIPATKSMQSSTHKFCASGSTKNDWSFSDQKRKLEIIAIELDTIDVHGVAVGTLTDSADYLMAFLNWRAIMLDTIKKVHHCRLLEDFSRTLCLDQVPPEHRYNWSDVCHHVFASFLRDRLPGLLLDPELKRYADATGILKPKQTRQLLQDSFGAHMMGRSFCVTKTKQYVCMGSGFMGVGDVIVVPFGCETPIILRAEGPNEYRYVGDIYVHGFMYGRAIDKWKAGEKTLQKYILH